VFYHVRDGSGNFLAAANRQKMISEPRGNEENADSDAPGNPTGNGKPSLSPAEPRPWLQRHLDDTFIGQDGLRSGWRLLLYLAIRKGLLLLLGVVIYWAVPPEMLPLWADLIIEFVMLVVAVTPAFLLARFEERPFGVYGLPAGQAFGKLFWVGAAWGLGTLTVLLFALHGAGGFEVDRMVLHGTRILKFASFWAVYFLVVSFAEEFYLRGYTLFTLTETIGFWPAAVVLSVLFAYLHRRNPGENLVGLLGAGVIGLFFCLTLRRTGSLWFAVGFHAVWDWGETYFYSVPDSGAVAPGHLLRTSLPGPGWLTGGSAGPEASVLLFAVIALSGFAFDRIYREIRYRSPSELRPGAQP
jgi:membrane protease YdiL (CAAX protease family)